MPGNANPPLPPDLPIDPFNPNPQPPDPQPPGQAPVAVDDELFMFEDELLLNIDLLGENPVGAGADSDPNGDSITLTEVNGQAVIIGVGITVFNLDGTRQMQLIPQADGTFHLLDINSSFDDLAATDSDTVQFTYTISDGAFSDTGTVTVNVQGQNDIPTFGGDVAGDVFEDTGPDIPLLKTSGQLTIADPDAGESTFTPTTVTGSNNIGTFTLGALGDWTYTANNTQTAVQEMQANQIKTDSFTAFSSDLSNSVTVTVTLHGVNDVPTITGDIIGEVTEDTDVDVFLIKTSGQLTIADTDIGQDFAFPGSGPGSKNIGLFGVDLFGTWNYSADTNHPVIQALGANQTLEETFTVFSLDETASQLLTVTIRGINDVPTTGPNLAADGVVTEDSHPTTLFTSGQLTIVDTDAGESLYQPFTDSSHGTWNATFTVDQFGFWTYTTDNTVSTIQRLSAGAFDNDAYVVHSFDGSAAEVVGIRIDGVNDLPTVTGDITGDVFEDAGLDLPLLITSGTFFVDDIDAFDHGVKSFTSMLGDYGTLTLQGNSLSPVTWVYTADNTNPTINALNILDTLEDSFTLLTDDETTEVIVTVTIHGANDLPNLPGCEFPGGPDCII